MGSAFVPAKTKTRSNIAKAVRTVQPGETFYGDEGYSVKHGASGDGGEYSFKTASGATGSAPYGGGLGTQRDAAGRVAQRIRAQVRNRSKAERRGNGTQGQPGLTSL